MASSKQKWRLRLSNDKQWQTQYTGFDPELELPSEFNEERAMAFLLAQARFADKRLGHIKPLLKFREYCHVFTRDVPEPLRKRVFHHTSVTEVKDQMLDWLTNYMMTNGKQKLSGEIHFDVKNPYEAFVEGFKEKIKSSKGAVSARGFMEFLATTAKPEYVEPWLLYPGQTLDELADYAKTHKGLPPEHKVLIEKLVAGYNESGLAASVKQMRDWANSPTAQAEKRIKVTKEMGPPYGTIQVGSLDTNKLKY